MGRCCRVNNRNNVLGVSETNTNLQSVNSCGCNTVSCNREETLLDNLCNFLGCNCNCLFDTNSRNMEEVNGILEEVGCDYITLRATNNGRKIICNTDTLQFVNIL